MPVPNLKRISIRSKVIRGSQNFEIWSLDPGHAHLGGRFVVRSQCGSAIYVCAIFEADISILGGHSSFSNTSVVSLFCALNITTVKINSGVHLLKS